MPTPLTIEWSADAAPFLYGSHDRTYYEQWREAATDAVRVRCRR